jgi:chromosome segregation ATPase
MAQRLIEQLKEKIKDIIGSGYKGPLRGRGQRRRLKNLSPKEREKYEKLEREIRLIKNREAAKNNRNQKKLKSVKLEEEIQKLREKNEKLREKNEKLKTHISKLAEPTSPVRFGELAEPTSPVLFDELEESVSHVTFGELDSISSHVDDHLLGFF